MFQDKQRLEPLVCQATIEINSQCNGVNNRKVPDKTNSSGTSVYTADDASRGEDDDGGQEGGGRQSAVGWPRGAGDGAWDEAASARAELTAAVQTLADISLSRCPCPSLLGDLRLAFFAQIQDLRSEMDNQVRCLESQLHGVKAVLEHVQRRQLCMEAPLGSGFTSDADAGSLTSSSEDDADKSIGGERTSANAARDLRSHETGEIPLGVEALPRRPDHCAWVREHIVTLLEGLDLSNSLLLTHLVADGVLSETEEEDILTHRTRKDKIRELLLKLRRCSREKFDAFLTCLQAEYPHLACLPFYNTETGENETSQRCITCDVTRRVALNDVMDVLFHKGAITSSTYEQLWRGTSARQGWQQLLDHMNARNPKGGMQILGQALERKYPDLSRRLLLSGMATFTCLCDQLSDSPPLSQPTSIQLSPAHESVASSDTNKGALAAQGWNGEGTPQEPSALELPRNPRAVCLHSEDGFNDAKTAASGGSSTRSSGSSICEVTGESCTPKVLHGHMVGETVPRSSTNGVDLERVWLSLVGEALSEGEQDAFSSIVENDQQLLGRSERKDPRYKVVIQPKGRKVHFTRRFRRWRDSQHLQK